MTGLRNKAILEIDLEDSDGTTHTGVFELREDLTDSGNVNKLFLLSNRGQYIREAFDIGSDYLPDEISSIDSENRRGYFVDGGAGTYSRQLSGKAGDRDAQWGDGSTDPNNPDDINRYDATGCDPIAQQQILEWYVAQAKTDSLGQARLHIGEWTDGTHGTDAGVFSKPLTVAVQEVETTKDTDDPSSFEVMLDLAWTAVTPEAFVDEVNNWIDDIAESIPEY